MGEILRQRLPHADSRRPNEHQRTCWRRVGAVRLFIRCDFLLPFAKIVRRVGGGGQTRRTKDKEGSKRERSEVFHAEECCPIGIGPANGIFWVGRKDQAGYF